jgi:diguanylate cyclase (GGDEF)-like protein
MILNNLEKKKNNFLKLTIYCLNYLNLKKVTQNRIIRGCLLGLSMASLAIAIHEMGTLQGLELVAFDRKLHWRTKEKIDPRILVVEISEADIRQQKKWPLNDLVIANVIEKLQQSRAKAIGLDIYRDFPYPPGREKLFHQLLADNVIAVSQISYGDTISPPAGVSKNRIGFNDLILDNDNTIRRHLIYAELGNEQFYSFALLLSLKYLEKNSQSIAIDENAIAIDNQKIFTLKSDSGGYHMSRSEASGWQILLNANSAQNIQKISFSDVLTGKFSPDLIRDKIVLIGTTAPSAKDLFVTAYTSGDRSQEYLVPGVIIHAQIVAQIIDSVLKEKSQFWFWEEWIEWLSIILWSVLGVILGWKLHNPLALGFGLILGTSCLWGICLLLFLMGGWIPFVAPLLGFILTTGTVLAYKVFYITSHDSVTRLPNLRSLTKKIQKFHKTSQQESLIATICINLTRFNAINDGLGYKYGELLLIATAKRLQAILSDSAQLTRLSGEEFAVFVPYIENLEEVSHLADLIERILTEPFKLNEREIFTTIAIGIVCYPSLNKYSAEYLLRDAHNAMYIAKKLNKTRHQLFRTGMNLEAKNNLEIEDDLRQALQNKEFVLYYQPIVALDNGKISGFEALIRWQSPTKGFISPGDFIPVAEDTNLIIPIGTWVLEEACAQMYFWQQQFPQEIPLTISVNISSKQFAQVNLIEQIKKILHKTKLPPQSLKLEITESSVMENVENTISLLKSLKSLGIKLSMDDFGTGFSSFSYLHRFPIDSLKIDRSFVNYMGENDKNSGIVNTIIMLGKQLSMDVVAEGIEKEKQIEILRTLQCEYGQGYFFAKPLPVQAITELLRTSPQW